MHVLRAEGDCIGMYSVLAVLLYCCIAVLLYGATVGEGQGGMAVWPNTLLYLLYENLYSQKLYGPAAGL